MSSIISVVQKIVDLSVCGLLDVYVDRLYALMPFDLTLYGSSRALTIVRQLFNIKYDQIRQSDG